MVASPGLQDCGGFKSVAIDSIMTTVYMAYAVLACM